MAANDKCCTIVPYLKIHEGKRDAFRQLCQKFVERSQQESGCLYYGWSFDGDLVHCREGYKDARSALAHLQNVGDLMPKLLELADLARLEIHGPPQELEQLRAPLADMNPTYFILEYGFRR